MFQCKVKTLPPSEAFPFLVQMMTYNNSDWAAVYLNLNKAWRWWGMIVRVLENMGATVRSQGKLYKALAQSVLLCGRKISVVTGEMLKVLT